MSAVAKSDYSVEGVGRREPPVAPVPPPLLPSPPGAPPVVPVDPNFVSVRNWIAVLGALLGAFMAVLDIQITNASLKDVTGALGATLDEGSWISTSYLTTEIVIIPLTGWLCTIFSVKRYLMATASLFLVFSVLCGFAWNLPSMIFFRAFQGLTGGALIPMSFQIILTNLPPAKRPTGFALFGVTATFAPSIGPTIGGWLTENYSWPLIFFINIIPGAALVASTWYAMDPTPMNLERLRKGDWWGIATLAVGLATLTVFLEEGERKDWFGSSLILQMAITSAISLTAFLCIELWISEEPVLNLRLFGGRNFLFGSIVAVALGAGMYSSSFVLPLYLAQVQGYNSLEIGRTIMWSGVPQLFLMPLVPKLMTRVDSRILIGLGLSIFGASCFMNYYLDADVAYDQLRFSQVVRALGSPLIIVPLSSLALAEVKPVDAGSASGLFNMMRNLGGSIGIALTTALLTQREHLHSNRIGEHVGANDTLTFQRLASYTHYFIGHGIDKITAGRMALGAIDGAIRRQAFLMAYGDCFFLIGVTLLMGVAAVCFCKGTKGGGGAGAH